jgi:hypothetical protein
MNAATAAAGVAVAGWLLLRARAAARGVVFEVDVPFSGQPGDEVSFAVRRDEDGCKVNVLEMNVSESFDPRQLLGNALLVAYASGMITPGEG